MCDMDEIREEEHSDDRNQRRRRRRSQSSDETSREKNTIVRKVKKTSHDRHSRSENVESVSEISPVDVTQIRKDMIIRIDQEQRNQKDRFDDKRSPARCYAVDDLVMLRITSTPSTGTSRKLEPKWRGPFRVTRVLEHDRYEVGEIAGCRGRKYLIMARPGLII